MASPPDIGHETVAVIVAAGRGLRAGGGLPKQYRQLAGRPVLAHTVQAFAAHPCIDAIRLVIHPDDEDLARRAVAGCEMPLSFAFGGASRADSVLNGLRGLSARHVLIHDAARPFVSAAVIDAVLDGLSAADGAVAMVPAVDAMRAVENAGRLGAAVPREGVARAQTPQGFALDKLRDAMERAVEDGRLAAYPDEASIGLGAGLEVIAVPGDPINFKLTTPEDFAMAERLLQMPDIRVGQGFDVHAFAEGDHVMLCGVRVPHERALSGHSDADVGLHALTDALLGAIASGDIGRHFPPSDPQWKGADSALFLEKSVRLVAEAGFAISNADITLICERPKIGPHSEAMRERVAALLQIPKDRVSVKATTTEKLGFCGRGEGIAAQASACVIRRAT